MVQTTSLFSQLLKLLKHFPRAQFQSLVKEHGAERAPRGGKVKDLGELTRAMMVA